ncbi:hypothetical protein LWF15_10390 [Kineosporia rhizophila]|uniref:hypothetical protein n=1 Tax=Kineosporia rhizophila TaxID=84633 RepID=UPI001E5B1DB4|nr:hypothetical protein [Kineosporia rhizophila]MCE0535921.1 hypothetical protein [Kineosporia rhizophila]
MVQTWSGATERAGAVPGRDRRAGLREQLEHDAATDGFGRRLTWNLFWLPLTSLAVLLASAVVFRPEYDKMLHEDWPVEWAQFAGCLFICVVALMSVRPALRGGRPLLAGLLLLSGLAWFFLAGEEISWAQRVFGFATPGGFEGNRQAEANLHNFDSGFDPEAVFRGLQVVIGLGMSALALYARLGRVRPDSSWRIAAPPLCTVPLFLTIVGYRFLGLFVPEGFGFYGRLQEWAEFCQYAGLTAALVCVYWAVQPQTEPVGGRARHALRPRARRDWRRLLPAAVVVLVITLVFALLTPFSGLIPGNAPGQGN